MGCEVSISVIHPDNDTTVNDTTIDNEDPDIRRIEKVSVAKPIRRIDSVDSLVSIDSR
jgi:hypothetical protein